MSNRILMTPTKAAEWQFRKWKVRRWLTPQECGKEPVLTENPYGPAYSIPGMFSDRIAEMIPDAHFLAAMLAVPAKGGES